MYDCSQAVDVALFPIDTIKTRLQVCTSQALHILC
jgi:hypothetical protein